MLTMMNVYITATRKLPFTLAESYVVSLDLIL